MIFMVSGRQAVEARHVWPQLPHVHISVHGTGEKRAQLPENPHRVGALFLEFDDIEHPVTGLVMFSPELARRIREFVEAYRDAVSLILCQCEAGISRSAAIAVALADWFGESEQADKIRGRTMPNRLVLRLLKDELNGITPSLARKTCHVQHEI